MKPAITREFLFEYFRGKATSIQKQLLDNWIRDPENEEIFYQYLEEWERLHPQYMVEVSKGIQHFKVTLHQDGPRKAPVVTFQKPPVTGRRTIWLAAASIILVFAAMGWIYREPLMYTHFRTTPGEITPCLLPDGSQVILNANSSLRVSRLWKLFNEREVFLSGEAEFRVTKDESARKFTVRTDNNVEIVVTGTVFTVFNRNRRTEVALNEGKVKLTQQVGNSTKTIEMVPGDKVLVEENREMVFARENDLPKTGIWKHRRFEFDHTSLGTVSEILKESYYLEAIFAEPDIESHTITGSFVAVSADEFLESICLMNGLRYEKTGQTVRFYKESQ